LAQYPYPIIAREGWPFLGGAIVLALAVTWLTIAWFASWALAIPFWLLALFVLQFFRDPPRVVAGDGKSVLAPADGRIVAIQPARDPWLDRDALKISVFMNVFNVHSNRSPVDGQVIDSWYHPGKFFNADLDKASLENERNALHIRCADGQDVTCVQVAGLIARRILCYVGIDEKLERGQRYGFIRFGSRVDLYLPTSVRVKVTAGDKVSAASTVLAELQ
jgi:phosphatidylserine decarboxylase